jgi:transcriptional regulator with PAS, ATPase and Fis domain
MGRKRSNINALSRMLATCSAPVYAVDSRRKIIYCNGACTEWLGVEAGDLIGRQCDYHSGGLESGPRNLGAELCPPPDVFRGQRATVEFACRTAGGQLVRRRGECLPLGDRKTDFIGAIVIIDREDLPDEEPASNDIVTPSELHGRLRLLLDEMGSRYGLDQIIGISPAITRVREQVRLAAASDSRVLVVGPPGSGREYMARSIHYGGRAKTSAPLAPLACSLLDAELLETTITSFISSCAQLETEQPPALLLLEVDQLPPDAQSVLAGVLSIGELNVRTIATARTPLVQLAEDDRFRRDLAFALSTLVVQIPPLADRTSDIPLLAQYFLERTNADGGKQLGGFSQDAMDQLLAYPWPDNVDELSDLVRSSCEKATGPVVQASDLSEKIRLTADVAARPPRVEENIVLDDFLAEIEKELLQRAMRQAKGNKAKAARLLGVTRQRVLRRVDFFGIE